MACAKAATILPFKTEICCGLSAGHAVRVQLFVKEDACRFQINFNCDSSGEKIAFHFNPRQDEQVVALNTKDGCWQQQENGPGCFLFHRGQYFDVLFIASDGCFDIYVNGKFFTSYKFRIALEKVHFLDITGDIILMDVDIKKPLPKNYIHSLPSSLKKWDTIAVKGFFYHGGDRFIINLINGTCSSNDIALHFNPRRDKKTIVLNSQHNGCWGKEEIHPLPCQLQNKTPFDVEILYACSEFKIYLNGCYLASFAVRGNVSDIRRVSVEAEAYFYEIQLLKTVDKPFVEKLPIELSLGSWICITGRTENCPDRFDINLQCGGDSNYGCDVAFHFNPRFKEGCIVRNSLTCGKWGVEERDQSTFPFKPENRFEVIILRLCGVFKVFVNYKYYIDYAHRVDAERVSHVMLTGAGNFLKPECC